MFASWYTIHTIMTKLKLGATSEYQIMMKLQWMAQNWKVFHMYHVIGSPQQLHTSGLLHTHAVPLLTLMWRWLEVIRMRNIQTWCLLLWDCWAHSSQYEMVFLLFTWIMKLGHDWGGTPTTSYPYQVSNSCIVCLSTFYCNGNEESCKCTKCILNCW